jgi:hypothetical protein
MSERCAVSYAIVGSQQNNQREVAATLLCASTSDATCREIATPLRMTYG